MRLVLVPFLLMTVAFAGCTDDSTAAPGVTTDDPLSEVGAEGVRDLRKDLTIEDELPAPEWEIGDWFGHHIFFGGGDPGGTHINTVVTSDSGSSWLLATDNQDVANWEAAWDFPMLGSIDQSDLGATAFGASWDIYDFPMKDGKTWTASIDPLFSGPRDVTFTATYNAKIETPYGIRPGFDITGVNAEGVPEIITDYVPEIGWYSKLTLLQSSSEDPEDFIFDIIAMGRGESWTGTYYINEGRPLSSFSGQVAADSGNPSGAASSTPPHHETFTMGPDSTTLYGIIGGGAISGESRFAVVDPANQIEEKYSAEHHAAPGAPATFFEFIDQDAVPGDWSLNWAGYGLAAWGFTALYEITEHAFIM